MFQRVGQWVVGCFQISNATTTPGHMSLLASNCKEQSLQLKVLLLFGASSSNSKYYNSDKPLDFDWVLLVRGHTRTSN